MLRFFIPLEDIHTKHLHLRGQSARQVARVLRLKAGWSVSSWTTAETNTW